MIRRLPAAAGAEAAGVALVLLNANGGRERISPCPDRISRPCFAFKTMTAMAARRIRSAPSSACNRPSGQGRRRAWSSRSGRRGEQPGRPVISWPYPAPGSDRPPTRRRSSPFLRHPAQVPSGLGCAHRQQERKAAEALCWSERTGTCRTPAPSSRPSGPGAARSVEDAGQAAKPPQQELSGASVDEASGDPQCVEFQAELLGRARFVGHVDQSLGGIPDR